MKLKCNPNIIEMCKISDDIKLCSCSSKKLIELDNSWSIYRKRKGLISFGETVSTPNKLKVNLKELERIVSHLNSKKIFDFDFIPQEDDKLELNFKLNSKASIYIFTFNQKKWKIKNDDLSWMDDESNRDSLKYGLVNSGRIEDPFKGDG